MFGPMATGAKNNTGRWWWFRLSQMGDLRLAKRGGLIASNGAILGFLQRQRNPPVCSQWWIGRLGNGQTTAARQQNDGRKAGCFDRFDGMKLTNEASMGERKFRG